MWHAGHLENPDVSGGTAPLAVGGVRCGSSPAYRAAIHLSLPQGRPRQGAHHLFLFEGGGVGG